MQTEADYYDNCVVLFDDSIKNGDALYIPLADVDNVIEQLRHTKRIMVRINETARLQAEAHDEWFESRKKGKTDNE